MLSRLKQALCQTELHLFLFLIFLFLFLIPILRGDGPGRAADSYRHFFLVWGGCIGALFLITRVFKTSTAEETNRKKN